MLYSGTWSDFCNVKLLFVSYYYCSITSTYERVEGSNEHAQGAISIKDLMALNIFNTSH